MSTGTRSKTAAKAVHGRQLDDDDEESFSSNSIAFAKDSDQSSKEFQPKTLNGSTILDIRLGLFILSLHQSRVYRYQSFNLVLPTFPIVFPVTLGTSPSGLMNFMPRHYLLICMNFLQVKLVIYGLWRAS